MVPSAGETGASLFPHQHLAYVLPMPDKPTTVAQYLKTLPEDRREAMQAVRKVILDNLDKK
jgi:hypothetical protein